ncbi:MAG TPA: redoxin domain-containing protein [Candidatus Dormibacteraeota bacterium]|nr:redoxin domain-containing protein [Candidatus Dormibacteraeota bacterium]
MEMAVNPGDRAPDFELFSQEMLEGTPPRFKSYRLSTALREGPVVLHFFPMPFTGVCEAQMCAVRDNLGAVYTPRGVQVWGVTGHYPFPIQAWDREHHFGVPVLADYEHTVSEQYVGTYPDLLGLRQVTKRGVVAVSQDGVVRYVWVTENPLVAPNEEVVEEAVTKAKEG